MIHVKFIANEVTFGCTFQTQDQVQKALNWLQREYKGAKIVTLEIRENEEDRGYNKKN